MTRLVRRGGAAVLALALSAGLSACGEDGFDPETLMVTADNSAGSTSTDAVIARAIVLVKSKDATASALAGSIIASSDAKATDTLDTIEIVPDTGSPITLRPALAINPGQVIAWGTEAHQPLTVPDGGALKVGHFANVTMHFRTAGDIKLEVPVVLRDGFYSAIVPATGTTATQAERKLTNCATTSKTTTPKSNANCTAADAARTAAARAAARATGATTATEGAGAAAGKSGVSGLPSAKKAATRSVPARKAPAKRTAPMTAPMSVPMTHPSGVQTPAGHNH